MSKKMKKGLFLIPQALSVGMISYSAPLAVRLTQIFTYSSSRALTVSLIEIAWISVALVIFCYSVYKSFLQS